MPSKMRRNGKVTGWLAQVRRQGISKSRLCKTRDEALTQEADWIAEIARMETTTTPTALAWGTQYLNYCQSRHTQKTYQDKRRALDLLVTHVGQETGVDRITTGQVLEVLDKVARGRSGYAANKVRKDLIAAWNWAVKYMDLWPAIANPIVKVNQYSYTKRPRQVPPMSDVQKVLDAMQGQDRAMLMTYLHTAARRDEVFRLQWQDIDFAGSRITLWTRKRKSGSLEPDVIPMTKQLREALINHRAENSGAGLVFTHKGRKYKWRQHWLKYWCGIVGVPRFCIHSIRHLTASWLDSHGVPLRTIQAILRHKSATTTSRYLHELSGTQVDLDSVFEVKEKGKVIEMNCKQIANTKS
jgi:integrase